MLATLPSHDEMYDALVRRDQSYEGIFVVGVKTTGIFCRPSCPARKPQPQNVEYFVSSGQAMAAGYRPCKRCAPLQGAADVPPWLQPLLDELEADPEVRLRDADLRARGLDPARVRRWFLRQHGMTFHAMQRARRLGEALGRIQRGGDLTQAAYEAGYESPSGFRTAFAKLFGAPPGRAREGATRVVVRRIGTPLGPMVAGATDDGLCLLEFADRRMLETQIATVRRRLAAEFAPGDNDVLRLTAHQLDEYFDGQRRAFDVPLRVPGTEFQEAVWQALTTIPYGATRSYAQQAQAIGRRDAVRAVGKANGDNRIAIIIPCHRVVGADGQLVGYGGQLWRKRALLDLESSSG